MPSLFKRGDRFYLAFHDAAKNPSRKQVSLRVSGSRAARAKAAHLTAEYELGSYNPWSSRQPKEEGRTLSQAVCLFVETRSNLSPQSIQKYSSVLGQFSKWMGPKKRLGDIGYKEIQSFIDGGNRKAVTKKTYSTTLSPFFNWSIEQGWMQTNPIKKLRLPKIQQSLPRALTQAEVQLLLDAVDGYDSRAKHFKPGATLWMKDAIRIAVVLGLRASELCQLQWEDVDYQNKTIRIGGRPGFKTKNAKRRLLPMTPVAEKIFNSIPEAHQTVIASSTGRKLSERYLSVRFKTFVRLCGLDERVSLHSLRHTACTNLITAGVPIEAVRLYMGHSSLVVTQRYIHLTSESLYLAINRSRSNPSPKEDLRKLSEKQ